MNTKIEDFILKSFYTHSKKDLEDVLYAIEIGSITERELKQVLSNI